MIQAQPEFGVVVALPFPPMRMAALTALESVCGVDTEAPEAVGCCDGIFVANVTVPNYAILDVSAKKNSNKRMLTEPAIDQRQRRSSHSSDLPPTPIRHTRSGFV